MKQLFLPILLSLFLTKVAAQEMTSEQLKLLEGLWTGDLVYLDYSSNKEVKIPVELRIEKSKEGKYRFNYVYPEEPKANSKSNVMIDLEKGTIAGDQISETKEQGSTWVIVAYSTGKDNGKKARFIKTYTIGTSTLSIKKEIQYASDEEPFLRNEYRLKK